MTNYSNKIDEIITKLENKKNKIDLYIKEILNDSNKSKSIDSKFVDDCVKWIEIIESLVEIINIKTSLSLNDRVKNSTKMKYDEYSNFKNLLTEINQIKINVINDDQIQNLQKNLENVNKSRNNIRNIKNNIDKYKNEIRNFINT